MHDHKKKLQKNLFWNKIHHTLTRMHIFLHNISFMFHLYHQRAWRFYYRVLCQKKSITILKWSHTHCVHKFTAFFFSFVMIFIFRNKAEPFIMCYDILQYHNVCMQTNKLLGSNARMVNERKKNQRKKILIKFYLDTFMCWAAVIGHAYWSFTLKLY